MGFTLTSPAPEKCDPTAKNRVWGFFGEQPETSRPNHPRTLQPRRENHLNTTKVASGRTYWPSRDPIGENGGINLYGMVGNDAVGRWDYLGLTMAAPPEDFIKKDGDCVTLTLKEFWIKQVEWGAIPNENEVINSGFGCIGICHSALDKDHKKTPEEYPGTKCWAGPKGRKKAEEAAKKCPKGQTPVVWSKQGAWKDPKNPPKDGDPAATDSVTHGPNGKGDFNYVTKMGSYYLDMHGESWKDPKLPPGPSNLDVDKGKVTICKGPIKNGRSAEIWCMSCCPDKDKDGYNDGYKK